ncbi:hypothetical protein EDD11_009504 [Mortierella claussenii]|nr:hypothetical protein EDD11_009504 [Mortierella claussenii]
MSARRFADARALTAVSASVSRKFLALELRQLKAYAATSSLLKKTRAAPVTAATTAATTPDPITRTTATTLSPPSSVSASVTQEVDSAGQYRGTAHGSTTATRPTTASTGSSWIDQLFTSSSTPLKMTSTTTAAADEPMLLDPSFLATPAAHGYRRPTITTTTPPRPNAPPATIASSTPSSSSLRDSQAGKQEPVNRDALETLRRESKWLDAMAAEDITMLNRGAAEQASLWAQRERLGPRMMVYEPLTEAGEDLFEEDDLYDHGTETLVTRRSTMTESARSAPTMTSSTLSLSSSSSDSATIPTFSTPVSSESSAASAPVSSSAAQVKGSVDQPSVDTLKTSSLAASEHTIPTENSFSEEEIKYEPVKKNLTEASMPTSRVSRLLHYGGLAASLGMGAISETVRRSVGRGASAVESPSFLTPANMDRLVNKLTRMRGAALKLGQMLSIQDNKLLPPELEEVLSRVQNSANFMPEKQMRKVMSQTMGSNWESEFSEFGMTPIAAASIGQVHKAIHRATGMPVAVKIQYPGVAASIDSDLSNLKTLVLMSSLLPRGMYLDNTIKVAQRELGWETDYLREADCIEEFGRLLKDDKDFRVPQLVREASGPMVLTMEWMDGQTMNQAMQTQSQEVRDRIGTSILGLCLRELFEFQYMQTDPNWTNFLYDPESTKLELLDFGATRGFDSRFTSLYLKTISAGAAGDREGCLKYSRELGFLTGEETMMMETAHINSLLTISEPFQESAPDVYDFKFQTITQRVKDQIPTMLKYRLTPPPDETYAMHRKLAGAFLLCSKLGSRVECKKLFREITSRYNEAQVDERRGLNYGKGA